jgi:hypothetical protein
MWSDIAEYAYGVVPLQPAGSVPEPAGVAAENRCARRALPLEFRAFQPASNREKVMKPVVRTDEYTIYQKRNERYAIRDSSRVWVNGDAKVAILLQHKLIEAPAPKAPEPAAEEPAAEEPASEEASAEPAGGEAAADQDGDEAESSSN